MLEEENMLPSLRLLPEAEATPVPPPSLPSLPRRIDPTTGAPEASLPPRGTIWLCPPPGLLTSIPSRKRNRGFLFVLAVVGWDAEVDPAALAEGVEGLQATQGMTDIVTPSSVSPALLNHTRGQPGNQGITHR